MRELYLRSIGTWLLISNWIDLSRWCPKTAWQNLPRLHHEFQMYHKLKTIYICLSGMFHFVKEKKKAWHSPVLRLPSMVELTLVWELGVPSNNHQQLQTVWTWAQGWSLCISVQTCVNSKVIKIKGPKKGPMALGTRTCAVAWITRLSSCLFKTVYLLEVSLLPSSLALSCPMPWSFLLDHPRLYVGQLRSTYGGPYAMCLNIYKL